MLQKLNLIVVDEIRYFHYGSEQHITSGGDYIVGIMQNFYTKRLSRSSSMVKYFNIATSI
jgi:hypothetical protein